jgi:hypothetical protein
MRCPKCGFNSFEYYDTCKKCSGDLSGYKLTHSIASLVLPHEAKEKLAAEFRKDEGAPVHIVDAADTHDDVFSFDLPDDSPAAPVIHDDDPFNFDELSSVMDQPGGSQPDDKIFADLLESTSQPHESPFGVQEPAIPAPAAAKPADSPPGMGDFDLESFSWDETPSATPAEESKKPDDDFDSLFGDLEDNSKK